MKKVTIVVSSISRLGGGVSEVINQTIKNLLLKEKEDLKIEIVTLHNEFVEEDTKEYSHIVSVKSFKSSFPKRYGFSFSMLIYLLSNKTDIIHIHGLWMFNCLAVYLTHIIKGTQYIVTPHGMLEKWILNRSPKLKKIISALYQKKFIKDATIVQALTENEEEQIREYSGSNNIKVIPNFIDIKSNLVGKPKWLTKDFENRKVYLFLGRIHDKKGCVELAHAWEKLCSEDNKFSNSSALFYCGWIDDCEDFEKTLFTVYNKSKNIYYIGPVYNLEKDLSFLNTDFFILPSKSEGLPMVVLEAWAYGTPVLMTPECNLDIGFRENSAIKITKDVEGILDGLRKSTALTSNEIEKMRINAKSLANRSFSKDVIINTIYDLYIKEVR